MRLYGLSPCKKWTIHILWSGHNRSTWLLCTVGTDCIYISDSIQSECCNLPGSWAMDREKWTGLFPYIGNRAGSCPAFVGNDLLLWLVCASTDDGRIRRKNSWNEADLSQLFGRQVRYKYGADIEQKAYVYVQDKADSPDRFLLETSFSGWYWHVRTTTSHTTGHLASKVYDCYRLKRIGVVYQYVHPAASEDSLMYIAHTELYQHAFGA